MASLELVVRLVSEVHFSPIRSFVHLLCALLSPLFVARSCRDPPGGGPLAPPRVGRLGGRFVLRCATSLASSGCHALLTLDRVVSSRACGPLISGTLRANLVSRELNVNLGIRFGIASRPTKRGRPSAGRLAGRGLLTLCAVTGCLTRCFDVLHSASYMAEYARMPVTQWPKRIVELVSW